MAGSRHGFVRGANLPRESRLFEGRFGRMFRSLPALDLDPADPAVRDLAFSMAQPEGTVDPDNPTGGTKAGEGIMAAVEPLGPTAETDPLGDGEEGLIPAGYTYLGQFIDHDLTFDPASSMERQNDPDALVDFRTPRFDLDSVYGRGPDDQPYMYDMPTATPVRKFLLGDQIGIPATGHNDPDARDHLRGPANSAGIRRALSGDKRNDENVIVAQMHTIFLRFHNRLADKKPELDFEGIQQLVRWHYQWVVLHDYLPRIVGPDMVDSILPHLASHKSIFDDPPKLHHYDWKNDPYLPTEFSAAAFRFGHSMVRPVYRLSRKFQDLKPTPTTIEDKNANRSSRRMVFDGAFDPAFPDRGLNGFQKIPTGWAIEWDLFFGKLDPDPHEKTPERVQPAYKVDTSLVNPLASLPEFLGVGREANLAYRNLLRGFSMRLPCGEDVARAMGLDLLEPDWLRIGKAEDLAGFKVGTPFADFPFAGKKPFKDATPLWLYILAEGAKNALTGVPYALGPVGGRIVAETMIGLMLGDSHSFLSQDPAWKPMNWDAALLNNHFDMLDFINFAQGKPPAARPVGPTAAA